MRQKVKDIGDVDNISDESSVDCPECHDLTAAPDRHGHHRCRAVRPRGV